MKTEATTQPTRPTDLVPLWKALLSLDINENTFSAACRTREWLNPVREVHAETGKMWAQISQAVVDRYAAERANGGGHTNHAGAKKTVTYLMESEYAEAGEILTKHFGRDIAFARLNVKRVEADADESEAAEA